MAGKGFQSPQPRPPSERGPLRPKPSAAQGREFRFIPVPSVIPRHCPWCKGTGRKQGPPLNHAPDTVVGVGWPKCAHCKGTGNA